MEVSLFSVVFETPGWNCVFLYMGRVHAQRHLLPPPLTKDKTVSKPVTSVWAFLSVCWATSEYIYLQ
jgi:hypothetical protein